MRRWASRLRPGWGRRPERSQTVRGYPVHTWSMPRARGPAGSRIPCTQLVTAAPPPALRTAAMAGVDLPVFARRRTVYVISCPTAMNPFPLLIDPTGFWIRPEGTKFIAGFSPASDLDDQPLEPDYDSFESHLWPALAHRIPA